MNPRSRDRAELRPLYSVPIPLLMRRSAAPAPAWADDDRHPWRDVWLAVAALLLAWAVW